MARKKGMNNEERADRLEEIKESIKELLDEAGRLVRGTVVEDRAKAYWLAHLRISLDRDHGYLDRSPTMQSDIDVLRRGAEENEEAEAE